MAQHNITGRAGEEIALAFLIQQGYKFITTNFRSKVGELDIVAKNGTQIVFIEVKTRSSTAFGAPSKAITPKKLHSLIQTAEYFLRVNNLGQNYRIDAVEVLVKGSEVTSINHIKNVTL